MHLNFCAPLIKTFNSVKMYSHYAVYANRLGATVQSRQSIYRSDIVIYEHVTVHSERVVDAGDGETPSPIVAKTDNTYLLRRLI